MSSGSKNDWATLQKNVKVAQSGSMQVVIINESDVSVWFDEIAIKQQEGLIVQENHYDAWGLDLAGLNKAGSPEHDFKYNGIERVTDLDLNWDMALYRDGDSQLGRWWQIDPKIENMEAWTPYNMDFNSPIRFSDPLGDEPPGGEARVKFSLSFTLGTKKQSYFSAGIGAGLSKTSGSFMGGINLSVNLYNGGLGTRQGSFGKAGKEFTGDFVLSPSLTVGKGNSQPTSVYTFNAMSLSVVNNSFHHSLTVASNIVFNTEGRNQMVGAVLGKFSSNNTIGIYNDFIPVLSGITKDRWWTGGGSFTHTLPEGGEIRVGTEVFTGSRVNRSTNSNQGRELNSFHQTLSQRALNNGQTFVHYNSQFGSASISGSGKSHMYSQDFIHKYLTHDPYFNSQAVNSWQSSGSLTH